MALSVRPAYGDRLVAGTCEARTRLPSYWWTTPPADDDRRMPVRFRPRVVARTGPGYASAGRAGRQQEPLRRPEPDASAAALAETATAAVGFRHAVASGVVGTHRPGSPHRGAADRAGGHGHDAQDREMCPHRAPLFPLVRRVHVVAAPEYICSVQLKKRTQNERTPAQWSVMTQ
ncbi:hypothetical protein AT728_11725 [Streptomyces silvensis]|uniref:Uncharacterized protein n=1 Tax=Streptomyces silvensis TaxID=1765722 RepID=A0A0W7X0X1_9ACTN|nr:hypothetical protein AT728_11725 [Streptomyces silvensis]